MSGNDPARTAAEYVPMVERCPYCSALTVKVIDTAMGPANLFDCQRGCKGFEFNANYLMGEANTKMLAAEIAQLEELIEGKRSWPKA